jgi:methyl-accepting chemotaxis protein
MRFKYKLLSLPALAALFLLAILGLSSLLTRHDAVLLTRLQTGHTPAVALGRDLEVLLVRLRHAFLEAVSSGDERRLGEADEVARRFLAKLEEARANPVLSRERREALREHFQAYVTHARATSLSLLRREPSAWDALPEMNARHERARALLEEMMRHEQESLAAAFTEARALHRRSERWRWMLGGLCVLLLGGLSLWLSSQLSRPLSHLTRLAARIAFERDLTVQVDVRSNDEVGELAASFGQMVYQLRSMALALQEVVGELTEIIQRSTQHTQESATTLRHQANSLIEASAAVRQIRDTSEVAARKAEGVMEVALQAEQAGSETQISLAHSVQGLVALQMAVANIVNTISELTGQTAQAGEIVGRVKDLADQSNVLALNATIEAAHAGETGQSFTVVARQMRSLADQSLRSTVHIREILNRMMAAIRTTVSTTEGGSQQMESGFEQMRILGERLQALTEVVQQSSRAAQQIVATVGQQNEGISQMSYLLTRQQKAMELLVESTQQGQGSVERLNATFQRLKAVVDGFRV